jgi:hypothetical protein
MRTQYLSWFSQDIGRVSLGFVVVLAVVVSGGHAAAGDGSSVPSGRIDYAAQYAPFAGGIVMHGGWGPPAWKPLAETWKLEATGWSQMSVSNAPAMAHLSMTLDEQRQVLVACGQTQVMNGLHEIWEFNGVAWSKTGELSGTMAGDAEITYDSDRHRLVIFRASSTGQEETWEFNGSLWQKVSHSVKPVACSDGALFKYAPSLKKTVLVGNATFSSPLETWLWNGTNWSSISGVQPTNAPAGGMTYDAARGQLVLLASDMKTWTFDGSQWTILAATKSPTTSPLNYYNLAYDAARKVSVFFSGEFHSGSQWLYPTNAWEWNGTTWNEFQATTAASAPTLKISLTSSGQVQLSWPASYTGWSIVGKDRLAASTFWQTISAVSTVVNTQALVTLNRDGTSGFYRLTH